MQEEFEAPRPNRKFLIGVRHEGRIGVDVAAREQEKSAAFPKVPDGRPGREHPALDALPWQENEVLAQVSEALQKRDGAGDYL